MRALLEWFVGLFRAHDCLKHGHHYYARYDEVIDPRLDAMQVERVVSGAVYTSDIPKRRQGLLAKIYVKEICAYCGDCIERTEGLSDLEVLAHQAKRIA